MNDNTVRFALNVWAGWAPIILANNGFKAGQDLENARRRGVQSRAGADRQPGGHARCLCQRRRPHRLGARSTWCRFSWTVSCQRRQAQRQPGHAAHLQQVDWSNGGDGIVVRETSRPWPTCAARRIVLAQNSPVALLRAQHAGGGRRAAGGSQHDLHQRRLPGGRRLQRRKKNISRRRLLVARHLQPREGQGQPDAGHHRRRPTS